jgi:3-hydroxyisobutyrate dehydrogenase-like beta-hydroxyacid dehydrogenase
MTEASPTVGIIGVGIMGSAIARNVAKSGLSVVGYDPDPARMALLAEIGGRPLGSAAEIAAASDVALTSLPSVKALDETAAAIAASARPGLVVAELSTLPIEAKERARDRLASAGVPLLDCPLSGTGAQAVTGDLVVYASGDRAAFEKAEPVFARFARLTRHLGAFGNGSRMKFVANLLVAIHNVASAEAMVLGMKAGLDPATIVELVRDGAGNSRVFELRAPMMVANRYEPATAKITTFQKDVEIISEFAAGLGSPTPLFSATLALYAAAAKAGRGNEDTAAVCAILEEMAGLDRQPG